MPFLSTASLSTGMRMVFDGNEGEELSAVQFYFVFRIFTATQFIQVLTSKVSLVVSW